MPKPCKKLTASGVKQEDLVPQSLVVLVAQNLLPKSEAYPTLRNMLR